MLQISQFRNSLNNEFITTETSLELEAIRSKLQGSKSKLISLVELEQALQQYSASISSSDAAGQHWDRYLGLSCRIRMWPYNKPYFEAGCTNFTQLVLLARSSR
jgi:hypothetical protein